MAALTSHCRTAAFGARSLPRGGPNDTGPLEIVRGHCREGVRNALIFRELARPEGACAIGPSRDWISWPT